MILTLVRLGLLSALGVTLWYASVASPDPALAGDTTPAVYMGALLVLALANALVWAPVLAGGVSEPITSMFLKSSFVQRSNPILKAMLWCEHRGLRRLTVAFAFAAGVRSPDQPLAFYVGMKRSKSGSWFERVFAREVFRFNHTQHCLEAVQILKQHGIEVGPHPVGEITLALAAYERGGRPVHPPVPVPVAKVSERPRRNPQIRLFAGAEATKGETPDASDVATNPEECERPSEQGERAVPPDEQRLEVRVS